MNTKHITESPGFLPTRPAIRGMEVRFDESSEAWAEWCRLTGVSPEIKVAGSNHVASTSRNDRKGN